MTTLVTTPFGAESTASEVVADLDLTGKRVIVTGGASGTLKSPEQGAATSVLLATSPQLEGVGGRYFEDCNEAAVLEPGQEQGAQAGVAAYALDRGDADRLWDLSLDPIGRGRDGV